MEDLEKSISRIHQILILSFLVLLITILLKRKSDKSKEILKSKVGKSEILLVIAHPDDESMFFYPFLLNILSDYNTHILCLSAGNYYGIGNTRIKEMTKISEFLGVSQLKIVDIEQLQDGPVLWDEFVVKDQILDYLDKNQRISVIYTFDNKGISKHPNHIACYNGVRKIMREELDLLNSRNLKTYVLNSENDLFRFTLIVPLIRFFFNEISFFNYSFLSAYEAMSYHASQFFFFRKLHILFCSYTYLNSFSEMRIGETKKSS